MGGAKTRILFFSHLAGNNLTGHKVLHFGLGQISIRGNNLTIETEARRANVHEQQFAAL